MNEIKLTELKCLRCGHSWIPRTPNLPERCPKCNSPYWNKPRRAKTVGEMLAGRDKQIHTAGYRTKLAMRD